MSAYKKQALNKRARYTSFVSNISTYTTGVRVEIVWIIYGLAHPNTLPNITSFTLAFALVQQQPECASVARSIHNT